MVRYRWGLGLSLLVSLLVLVILGAVIIDRTVETPAEQLDQEKAQLDQELQLKAPPAYKVPGGGVRFLRVLLRDRGVRLSLLFRLLQLCPHRGHWRDEVGLHH